MDSVAGPRTGLDVADVGDSVAIMGLERPGVAPLDDHPLVRSSADILAAFAKDALLPLPTANISEVVAAVGADARPPWTSASNDIASSPPSTCGDPFAGEFLALTLRVCSSNDLTSVKCRVCASSTLVVSSLMVFMNFLN